VELLCIGIKDSLDDINKILDRQIDLFKKEDFNIDRKVSKIGDTTFLKYELEDMSNIKYSNIRNIFKHYIANAISDIVLDQYQQKIITRLVNERCYYFNKSERERIKNKTIDFLKSNEYITTEGIMYRISKKARILKAVIEYLDIYDEIIIEGFINFRLRFFMDTIEEAIDKNIEDYLMEKEYTEFIKILQYFVDIQEPKIDVVNVVISENKYELYDDRKRLINNDFLEEIADELSESNINYDDLLISSLITIAPRKVIIHIRSGDEKDEIIKIIENVFTNKSIICQGCELCKLDMMLKSIIKKEK